ncbi:MAG TPA: hypothetical protein VLW52_09730 [Opitutaceae bacterium]|nr:hypothetical protein [Opitutaceae bacterium]
MSFLPLTLSISLCLVFTLVVFFLREQARRPLGSAARSAHREDANPDGATAD